MAAGKIAAPAQAMLETWSLQGTARHLQLWTPLPCSFQSMPSDVRDTPTFGVPLLARLQEKIHSDD
jgi:hypothetical protein